MFNSSQCVCNYSCRNWPTLVSQTELALVCWPEAEYYTNQQFTAAKKKQTRTLSHDPTVRSLNTDCFACDGAVEDIELKRNKRLIR